MAICRKCAAPLIVGRVAGTGVVKAFDVHEMTFGPERYVRKEDGLYYPARETYSERAYVDHEATCASNHRQPA